MQTIKLLHSSLDKSVFEDERDLYSYLKIHYVHDEYDCCMTARDSNDLLAKICGDETLDQVLQKVGERPKVLQTSH